MTQQSAAASQAVVQGGGTVGTGAGGGTIARLPPLPAAAVAAPPMILTASSSVPTAPASNVVATSTAAAAVAPPPAVASASAASIRSLTDDVGARGEVDARMAARAAEREGRRRELLLEARAARVAWIRDDVGGGGGERGPAVGDDAESRSIGTPLSDLRACRPDALPCAPRIIRSLLSSCSPRPVADAGGVGASSRNSNEDEALRRALEREGLSWEAVVSRDRSSPKDNAEDGGVGQDGIARSAASEGAGAPGNDIPIPIDPPAVPSPESYAAFLGVLCEPRAADVVMSAQKFCETIRDAAGVMVESMRQAGGDDSGGGNSAGDGNVGVEPALRAAGSNVSTSSSRDEARRGHASSLAKALRGFINKTMREMEEHEAFCDFLYPGRRGHDENEDANASGNTNDEKPATMDAVAREELRASLERFIFSKCRADIDKVLLAEEREGVDGDEPGDDLHDKMLSLQFVTPAHLEIGCLKSCGQEDVDLSHAVRHLRSIGSQSSPRGAIRSILSAHRGVNVALNQACGTDDPPGADDVLPTLILATLRAHPRGLSTALRFVEAFASPVLLRGEAGYAHASLCGAVQFVEELDVEGHLAEVTLGGMGEGAVLHISPEEFRRGLEGCRRRMEDAEREEKSQDEEVAGDGLVDGNPDPATVDALDEEFARGVTMPPGARITARQVREARSSGVTVDLDWAMRKQQGESIPWREGMTPQTTRQHREERASVDLPRGHQRDIPPEEPPLPSQFARSYPFLAMRPENVGLRDLPRLLREYKLLVHATEMLLNERATWREDERRRRIAAERERLEGEFSDAMMIGEGGGEGFGVVANGH